MMCIYKFFFVGHIPATCNVYQHRAHWKLFNKFLYCFDHIFLSLSPPWSQFFTLYMWAKAKHKKWSTQQQENVCKRHRRTECLSLRDMWIIRANEQEQFKLNFLISWEFFSSLFSLTALLQNKQHNTTIRYMWDARKDSLHCIYLKRIHSSFSFAMAFLTTHNTKSFSRRFYSQKKK